MTRKLVVIGNGMAGMKAVEELISAAPDAFEITVFGAEPYGNYNRILLSPVLCGEKTIEDILINPLSWYEENKIRLLAGEQKTVVSIDRRKKTVIAADGTVASYDKLLIATGSTPSILPLPGNHLDGVMAFRDIYDVNKMLAYTRKKRHAIVVGGGLLGLEAANGLIRQGMHVTVVHHNAFILNRQLDATASRLLQAELASRGIQFKLSSQIASLNDNGETHIGSVTFKNGDILPCDLFVMAVGVQPNISLAKAAGLYCEQGIIVSDTLQTFDPSIYAVGECIQHRGLTFGLVAPLFEQAKVCANHLSAHGVAEYKTLPTSTKLKVSGIQLFSVGTFNQADDMDSIVFEDSDAGIYKKLILKNNRIQGVVLYGDTADGPWFQELLEKATDISCFRSQLIFGQACCDQQNDKYGSFSNSTNDHQAA
jgi:nitrite reductase (NADH) large subunit